MFYQQAQLCSIELRSVQCIPLKIKQKSENSLQTSGHVDLVHAEIRIQYNQITVSIQSHAQWSATSWLIFIATFINITCDHTLLKRKK